MIKNDYKNARRRSPSRGALSTDEIDHGLEILESFENERVSNRRIAKIGFFVFFIFAFLVIIYFELTSDSHRVLQAEIIGLDIEQNHLDLPNKFYIATIKLSSGKTVNAKVERNTFDKLSLSDQVYVKYYEESERYEVVDFN